MKLSVKNTLRIFMMFSDQIYYFASLIYQFFQDLHVY